MTKRCERYAGHVLRVTVLALVAAASCVATKPGVTSVPESQDPKERSVRVKPSTAPPALRDELIAMMEVDTEARAGMCESAMNPEDAERRRQVDRRHTSRLKAIIAQYGWPTYSMVGREGAVAAWLMAQHADHDVAFQQQCQLLLKEAY